jgi:hypothetical protein
MWKRTRRTRVRHPLGVHSARIGRELVAGMAQVVNVDGFQADSGERRNPYGVLRIGYAAI